MEIKAYFIISIIIIYIYYFNTDEYSLYEKIIYYVDKKPLYQLSKADFGKLSINGCLFYLFLSVQEKAVDLVVCVGPGPGVVLQVLVEGELHILGAG